LQNGPVLLTLTVQKLNKEGEIMYINSPFMPPKVRIDRKKYRDGIRMALEDIEQNTPQETRPLMSQKPITAISADDFELLRKFLDKRTLEPYLPQFIQDHHNINDLITEIKKFNALVEQSCLEDRASSLINNDTPLICNQSLFDKFSSIWDNAPAEDSFGKAKTLLDIYLGSNNCLEMFARENLRTTTLGRQHFAEIKQLKEKCNKNEIKAIYTLLGALGNITIKNPQGHLQAIIAVITHKLRESEEELERNSRSSRHSRSSLSFNRE
jgi:hypothetical protein